MALPNLWKLHNLRSSPYFQTTLHQGSQVTPTRLFVGRQRERQQLLSTIAGGRSSRQAVAGRPGLGKTTLVQAVKADALAADYWVADERLSITPGSSNEVLLGQLLAGAYDAVLSCKPDAAGAAVAAAQQLVRTIRLRHGGFSRSVGGFGGGGSRSEVISDPPGALVLDGPRLLRDLLDYALKEGAQGMLLHLNNLENLSEVDAERAADMLRGIRDQVLLLDGLHVIVVGTTDAVRTVVQHHTQVRSVFSNPVVLDPLPLPEVHQLLDHRYRALQLDPDRSWHAPVTDAVVEQMYHLFRGDLRGMLNSLEDGLQDLLGLTIEGDEARPIGLEDLRVVLKRRNRLELEDWRSGWGVHVGSGSCAGRRWIQPQDGPRLNWQSFGGSNNPRCRKPCNNSWRPVRWKPCRGAGENPSNTCSQVRQDWQLSCYGLGWGGASCCRSRWVR